MVRWMFDNVLLIQICLSIKLQKVKHILRTCLNYFQRAFLKKFGLKQPAELSISPISFSERDGLDALRQYALHPRKLLALNPKSEVITVVHGVRNPHPLPNFLT